MLTFAPLCLCVSVCAQTMSQSIPSVTLPTAASEAAQAIVQLVTAEKGAWCLALWPKNVDLPNCEEQVTLINDAWMADQQVRCEEGGESSLLEQASRGANFQDTLRIHFAYAAKDQWAAEEEEQEENAMMDDATQQRAQQQQPKQQWYCSVQTTKPAICSTSADEIEHAVQTPNQQAHLEQQWKWVTEIIQGAPMDQQTLQGAWRDNGTGVGVQWKDSICIGDHNKLHEALARLFMVFQGLKVYCDQFEEESPAHDWTTYTATTALIAGVLATVRARTTQAPAQATQVDVVIPNLANTGLHKSLAPALLDLHNLKHIRLVADRFLDMQFM